MANSDTFRRLLVPLLQEWGSVEIDAKSSLNLAYTLRGLYSTVTQVLGTCAGHKKG